ncbi:acetyl-CoA synthetase-like protein [Massarina eburnea CBS 473.64]|uniref:Acetyl-CoA synthetase-like protein n=1 Tax=Massarina eburnea CBS 473.64 TaxID=1395130 RepID=A0A6A6SBA2_9PLEO|nr:acetyl-CoA synthetase-like protein [Massarina eburnea CBS 473.64]
MSEASVPSHEVPAIFRLSNAVPDRLIHLLPNELKLQVPDHILFSYPKTSDPRDGFIDVSAAAFADAIDRTSWYLRKSLGQPVHFETVAYMGPNDIRYFMFMFAAIKVGYKMLFLSPRNNLESHLNVLQGVDCQVFLRAHETDIDTILQARPMMTGIVPELHDLLFLKSPVQIYPYHKTFEEARMDPALVLHTTGSTGLPKPIIWKVGTLSTYEAWRTIPYAGDYVPTTEIYQQSRRAYTSMPLFHTSGLNAGITWALLLGVTLVYGAPHVVPNPTYMDEMHRYAGVDASMGAPSLYEELSRDEKALELINRFHYVVASGAPLSQTAGKLISQHTRVISNLGATETACLQRLSPSIADWDYFYWHPTHSGIEMREIFDGLYELFLVRDAKLALFQAIFINFPDLHEWSMNDLYERHPDPYKSFLYRYKGRKDDVIVLSNGEKVAPALMEATLMSSPAVKGAMVVGRGKFQPAVLIDLGKPPPQTLSQRHDLIQSLLPVLNEANEHAPAHAKLDQYHILFADPKRPVQYLGQGKIQRHRTYELYKDSIEELYDSAENTAILVQSELSNTPKLDFSRREEIIKWLQQLLPQLGMDKELGEHDGLLENGVDSLQIIRIARELRIQAKVAGLTRLRAETLTPKIIYTHSTLGSLSSFLVQECTGNKRRRPSQGNGMLHPSRRDSLSIHPELAQGLVGAERHNDSVSSMRSLLQKYTHHLPRQIAPRSPPATTKMTILLTGSTGSLGSYLLEALYHDKNVHHIICLNRSPKAAERHVRNGHIRGLSRLDPARVEFLKADLTQRQLNLDDSVYQHLVSTVTHVIHNQWPVNFNWPLLSFEPYIRGARHLVDLCIESTHNAHFTFVSSVSAVGSWGGAGPVPEKSFPGLDVASELGYGQSKLTVEALLDKAAQESKVRSACCRVGIVAGPVQRMVGLWNKHEYIPSIIISSPHLGVFPATFPSRDRVDWLPVDKLSHILVEIMVSSCETPASPESGTQVYHVINPNTTSWRTDFAKEVLALYPRGSNIRPVEFEEWVRALKQSVADMDLNGTLPVDQNPAIRLLDFYSLASRPGQEPRSFVSRGAEKASKTLREIEPINREWLNNWMVQWGIKNAFLKLQ